MEQFLQRNVPLRRLLNEEILFVSWRRSSIKELNDWALRCMLFHYALHNVRKLQLDSTLNLFFYVHAIFLYWWKCAYIFFLEGQIITDPKTGESQLIQTVIDPKTGKPKQIKTPVNAGNDFVIEKNNSNLNLQPPCHILYFWKTYTRHQSSRIDFNTFGTQRQVKQWKLTTTIYNYMFSLSRSVTKHVRSWKKSSIFTKIATLNIFCD